jgi:hypothetical protein
VTENTLTLGAGSVQCTVQDAEKVLVGYAFAEQPAVWDPPTAVGNPVLLRRPRWAYWTYDCTPARPYGWLIEDFTITAALNSQIGAAAILGMQAIAPALTEALAHIPADQTFWGLPHDHLRSAPPPAESLAWWLWRAWALLMGVPQINVAVAHKTLHHKRPWLFPLLDNLTVDAYPNGGAWAGIHQELTEQADTFTLLEQWFAAQAAARQGIPLTRLRIHDILLWATRAGEWDEARTHGAHLIGQNGPS